MAIEDLIKAHRCTMREIHAEQRASVAEQSDDMDDCVVVTEACNSGDYPDIFGDSAYA